MLLSRATHEVATRSCDREKRIPSFCSEAQAGDAKHVAVIESDKVTCHADYALYSHFGSIAIVFDYHEVGLYRLRSPRIL